MKKKKKNRSGMNPKKELEDIFSMLSLCSDSHAENIGREKIKSTGKKRGRPPKNPCRALIPLDTAKIRWEYQREYKRRKRVLERLETQLQQYEESDEPEFRKYLARTFGAEQTLHRELAEQIQKETDKEVRITVPGHTQRGGSPCAYDRVFATRVGAKAAELILNEEYGYMVAMRNGETVKVPLEEVAGKLKYVDPNCGLIKEARTIGISFGDEV